MLVTEDRAASITGALNISLRTSNHTVSYILVPWRHIMYFLSTPFFSPPSLSACFPWLQSPTFLCLLSGWHLDIWQIMPNQFTNEVGISCSIIVVGEGIEGTSTNLLWLVQFPFHNLEYFWVARLESCFSCQENTDGVSQRGISRRWKNQQL